MTIGIRELHAKIATLPLAEPDRLPLDLRLQLSAVLGWYLSRLLDAEGVTQDQVSGDFRAHRRSRR